VKTGKKKNEEIKQRGRRKKYEKVPRVPRVPGLPYNSWWICTMVLFCIKNISQKGGVEDAFDLLGRVAALHWPLIFWAA